MVLLACFRTEDRQTALLDPVRGAGARLVKERAVCRRSARQFCDVGPSKAGVRGGAHGQLLLGEGEAGRRRPRTRVHDAARRAMPVQRRPQPAAQSFLSFGTTVTLRRSRTGSGSSPALCWPSAGYEPRGGQKGREIEINRSRSAGRSWVRARVSLRRLRWGVLIGATGMLAITAAAFAGTVTITVKDRARDHGTGVPACGDIQKVVANPGSTKTTFTVTTRHSVNAKPCNGKRSPIVTLWSGKWKCNLDRTHLGCPPPAGGPAQTIINPANDHQWELSFSTSELPGNPSSFNLDVVINGGVGKASFQDPTPSATVNSG